MLLMSQQPFLSSRLRPELLKPMYTVSDHVQHFVLLSEVVCDISIFKVTKVVTILLLLSCLFRSVQMSCKLNKKVES